MWMRAAVVRWVAAGWAAAWLLALGGCAAPAVQVAEQALPLDQAVVQVADQLFANLPKLVAVRLAAEKVADKASSRKPLLVLGPAFEVRSGQQSGLTEAFDRRLLQHLAQSRTDYTVTALKPDALGSAGVLVLAGVDGMADGRGGAAGWSLWLALVDAKSRTVLSRAAVRARADGIDQLPTPFYRDSPVLIRDDLQAGLRELFAPGASPASVGPAFMEAVAAMAQLAAPIAAYNGQKYPQALREFKAAAGRSGGDTLRSQVGIYVAASQVGSQAEVDQATTRIVDQSLARNALDVKMVYFRPGTTETYNVKPFNALAFLNAAARGLAQRKLCGQVVGHTSRTGTADYNLKLSQRRAEAIRQRLVDDNPELRNRLQTEGKGFSENLIGLGRDDDSDMADRRVEIKAQACA